MASSSKCIRIRWPGHDCVVRCSSPTAAASCTAAAAFAPTSSWPTTRSPTRERDFLRAIGAAGAERSTRVLQDYALELKGRCSAISRCRTAWTTEMMRRLDAAERQDRSEVRFDARRSCSDARSRDSASRECRSATPPRRCATLPEDHQLPRRSSCSSAADAGAAAGRGAAGRPLAESQQVSVRRGYVGAVSE